MQEYVFKLKVWSVISSRFVLILGPDIRTIRLSPLVLEFKNERIFFALHWNTCILHFSYKINGLLDM